MADGMNQERLAVRSGYWPLYRFDPRPEGSKARIRSSLIHGQPEIPLKDYIYNETAIAC